ncbi:MAG TPA: ArgR family transcriptional regulator [Spirochaetia bacterium]|nr:ArgR family transcriptional regulator [Spirochaetia bacterium]
MKDRSLRLKAIQNIVRTNRIRSQEDLLGHMETLGYHVTQATLSRDLKILKVGKVSEGSDGYYYTLPSDEDRRGLESNYIQDFQRGYISLEFSLNLAVVRTLSGHANSVALALDNLGLDDILGTVAGDDTVIAVLREGIDHRQLFAKLKEKVHELEE